MGLKLGNRADRRLAEKEGRRLRRANSRRRNAVGFTDKEAPVWKDVPNEPGCRFGFAQLAGHEMDEAQVRNIERTLKMDISEGMSKALVRTPERKADEDKPIEFRDCNNAVLVEYGLVAWKGKGTDAAGQPVDYDGVTCDTLNRRRLTDDVFRWAARQIFDMSHVDADLESSSEPSGRDGAGPPPTSSAGESSPSLTPDALPAAASR